MHDQRRWQAVQPASGTSTRAAILVTDLAEDFVWLTCYVLRLQGRGAQSRSSAHSWHCRLGSLGTLCILPPTCLCSCTSTS